MTEDHMGALVAAPVRLSAEIGRTSLPLAEVLELRGGAILDLDSAADDPADLYVNGRRLGTGKLVLVDGEWALQIEWLAGHEDVHEPATSAEY